MKKRLRVTSCLLLLLLIALYGCTSAEKKAKADEIAELQRMSSSASDMGIVVSAGTTKLEYSRRLTDALLKFGDRNSDCRQTMTHFHATEEEPVALEACQHLNKAMDAYVFAQDYFGLIPDPTDPAVLSSTLTEDEYAKAKLRFARLTELAPAETNEYGYKFYSRDAMVQALWKVATQEFEAANTQIEKLSAQ